MNTDYVKKLLDACHEAKKIIELLPELPQGMKPRHIHVIDAVHIMSKQKDYVKVSDVSEALKVTKPSITKLINELEDKDVILKSSMKEDNRITTITLTPLGERYYEIYVAKYHNWLAQLLENIDENNITVSVDTINKVHMLMESQKMKLEDEK